MSERRVAFDHTDPGLRPFIEVQAKVSMSILDEAKDDGRGAEQTVAELCETCHGFSEEGAREVTARVEPGRRLPIACEPGCDYCCYGTVFASSAEILHLAAFIARDPELARAVGERAAAAAHKVAGLSIDERAGARVPCPVLADGACSAYEARPLSCRAYHSCDRGLCERAFQEADARPVLPIVPTMFHIPHAHGFGMMAGLQSAGLDVGPYDLASALPVALADPAGTAERWLAGEAVFAHSTSSESARQGYASTLDALVKDLQTGQLDTAEKLMRRLDPDTRRRERNKRKAKKRR